MNGPLGRRYDSYVAEEVNAPPYVAAHAPHRPRDSGCTHSLSRSGDAAGSLVAMPSGYSPVTWANGRNFELGNSERDMTSNFARA